MKRLILYVLAVLLPVQLLGQLFPLSDHYFFNTLVINPAFAGCNDALSGTISYRNQWVGLEDAPKSCMVSVHKPIINDRMGLGLLIMNSSIGISKENSFMGNYAYRLELREGILSLGLGFGVTVYGIAWNDLKPSDLNDIQLMKNPTSTVLPNFSLGAYYYTKKYFIGFSMPMFLSHEPDKSTGKFKIGNNFSGSNYFLTGGYEIGIGPNVKLLPSMLIKYHPNNPVQVDFNAQVNLKDQIWLGLGYRNNHVLVGMLQCNLTYQLRIAYSYNFTMGSIGKYVDGSHEIGLNYILKYSRKVTGPRQF